MSKYTTEVRFICENKSGLSESKGSSSVDDILDKSWDKIFTTKCEFFDESYRETLCKKILKHYYLREICCETVGIWLMWMNTRLEEIMPYYNQLYKSELLDLDVFNNVNLTRKHTKKNDSTSKESGENSDESNVTEATTNGGSVTNVGTEYQYYSDTPQGALSGVDSNTYLTNVTKNTNNDTQTNKLTKDSNITSNSSGKNSSEGSANSNEEYEETVKGKEGGESYVKLLSEYRDTFLNIDLMVIEEFSDLFFGLW